MSTGVSTFNIWLKQRRRALDLAPEEPAECVGFSTVTIQEIELGERRPSKQVTRRHAECLNRKPDCPGKAQALNHDQACSPPCGNQKAI